MDKKVLVIGIDSGTWNVILPLIDAGKLPNIRRLIDSGITGDLLSSMPYTTFPAWKCYSTGKNPDRLNVYWLMTFDPIKKKLEVTSSNSFNSKEIWDILGESGLKCSVLNVPTTYPAKKINGVMISGPPNVGPIDQAVQPQEFIQELGDYIFLPDTSTFDQATVIEEAKKITDRKVSLAIKLLRDKSWDFFHFTFFLLDHVQHYIGVDDSHKGFRDFWEYTDKKIGEILEETDESTISIIMSDHGMVPLKCSFYINEWLIKNGYLCLGKRYGVKNLMRIFIKYVPPEKLVPVLLTLRIYKPIKKIFNRILKLKSVSDLNLNLGGLNFDYNEIDWTRSRAFAVGTEGGVIYIDKEVVGDKEYEHFRQKIIDDLAQLVDPKYNRAIFERVLKFEDFYKNADADICPDVILIPTQGYRVMMSLESKLFEYSSLLKGTHKREGIFIASGPGIKKGKIPQASITDIAPTILHILGLPVPGDMDGRVLTEIFKKDSEFASRQVVYEKGYVEDKTRQSPFTREEEEMMKKRLHDLGYL